MNIKSKLAASARKMDKAVTNYGAPAGMALAASALGASAIIQKRRKDALAKRDAMQKTAQLESRKDRLVSDAKSGAKIGAGLYGAHAALGGATLGGAIGGKKMAAKQAVKFGIAGGLKGAAKGLALGGLVGMVRGRKEKKIN